MYKITTACLDFFMLNYLSLTAFSLQSIFKISFIGFFSFLFFDSLELEACIRMCTNKIFSLFLKKKSL